MYVRVMEMKFGWVRDSAHKGMISAHGGFSHPAKKQFYPLWNGHKHLLVSGASDSACAICSPREEEKLVLGYTVLAEEPVCRRQCSDPVCCSVYTE